MNEGVSLSSPFLKKITLLSEKVDRENFPFNRFPDLLDDEFSVEFPSAVTFFIGENGTGKSTVLEAIASLCGFHLGGGGSDHQLHETADQSESVLAQALRPSWLQRCLYG